jgi:signal-transduction protein with cAMP-binding, CBS, and nucleotidyltransferase domain
LKKIFFHNEAIIKRGHPIINFFILIKGKANVLNSNGSTILKNICSGEVFGIIDNLKEKKWKNTVVSENKSEVLVIPKETLIKKIFSSKEFTALTLDLLKMAK